MSGFLEGTCLLRSTGGYWKVLETERGYIKNETTHQYFRSAVDEFYWRLTRPETSSHFVTQWEFQTGENITFQDDKEISDASPEDRRRDARPITE